MIRLSDIPQFKRESIQCAVAHGALLVAISLLAVFAVPYFGDLFVNGSPGNLPWITRTIVYFSGFYPPQGYSVFAFAALALVADVVVHRRLAMRSTLAGFLWSLGISLALCAVFVLVFVSIALPFWRIRIVTP